VNAHRHKLKVGALLSSGGLQAGIPVERRRDLSSVHKGHHEFISGELDGARAQIAFPRLFERLQGLELTTDKFEWMDSLILRGVKKLPVQFKPISARRVAV
jgi:hypothetical protein